MGVLRVRSRNVAATWAVDRQRVDVRLPSRTAHDLRGEIVSPDTDRVPWLAPWKCDRAGGGWQIRWKGLHGAVFELLDVFPIPLIMGVIIDIA
jgi:hypothetical protein